MADFLLLDGTDYLLLDSSGDKLLLEEDVGGGGFQTAFVLGPSVSGGAFMRKNVASQTVGFQMVSATDGSAQTTGTPTVYYTIDGGTQGTGAGTSTHEGNGQWSYVPAQAETNGDHVVFTMAISGAVSREVNVWPWTSIDPTASTLDTNVTQISGDSTAADNLELMYDGTGYTDDTAPASRSQVDNIGAASGGAVNIEATSDNTGGGSLIGSGSDFVGSVVSGTFANTQSEDGTPHEIDDTGNDIDVTYGYDIGSSRTATQVSVVANLDGNADEMKVKAWDFGGTTWDTIGTLEGSGGSDYKALDLALLSKHTGTGGNIGEVYIRFDTESTTPATLQVDKLLVSAVANEAGIANGSTVTLGAATTNTNLSGYNWDLALGGQNITGSFIRGATVTGTSSGSDVTFEDCMIGAATIPPGTYLRCALTGTATLASAGDYFFDQCYSGVAGSGSPTLDYNSIGSSSTVNIRNWSGGLAGTNIAATTVSSWEFVNGGTAQVNGTGGTVHVRGRPTTTTDNSGGNVTLNTDGVVNQTTINAQVDTAISDAGLTEAGIADAVWDEAQADHTTAGTFGEMATETAAILDDTGTSGVVIASGQTVATVTGNVNGSVASVTGNVGGNVVGSVASVTAQVSADVTAISGDSTAADNLEASLETMLVGAVSGAGSTASSVDTTLTGYGDDTWIGRIMLFRTGTLQYEAGAVTDYDSTTGTFTFATDTWTTGASDGDDFVLV